MSNIISTIGILLVMIGTIFSLWSILSTKGDYVGSCQWWNDQQDNFKKDKKKVIFGIMLIMVGSVLQITGLFL